MEVAACLYDVPAIAPPVRIVSEQDYIAEAMAGVDEVSEEDCLGYERSMRALALLGLVPGGLTLKEATAADLARRAGFYELDDRQISIIDRGVPLDAPSPILTLVHEFIHALQHEATDVFDGSPKTSDAYLALTAIIEGEASLFEDMAAVEGLGWGVDELDLTKSYSWWQTQSFLSYLTEEDPLHAAKTRFVYPYGAAHAYRAWKLGGHAKIAERRATIPDSVHAFLVDPDEMSATAEPVHEPLGERAFPKLGDSFALLNQDEFGPWLLIPLIHNMESGEIGAAVDFATELRGDSIAYFYNGDDDTVLAVWRMRFATSSSAETLVRAVDAAEKPLRAWREERDAIVLASDSKEHIDQHYRKLEWEPVPPQVSDGDADRGAERSTACSLRSLRSVFGAR